MARYIARRMLLAIPVLLGASFLIFAMVFALPGDPIRALAGDRPLSPSVQAQLRDEYNLDDSLPVQYGKYVGALPRATSAPTSAAARSRRRSATGSRSRRSSPSSR